VRNIHRLSENSGKCQDNEPRTKAGMKRRVMTELFNRYSAFPPVIALRSIPAFVQKKPLSSCNSNQSALHYQCNLKCYFESWITFLLRICFVPTAETLCPHKQLLACRAAQDPPDIESSAVIAVSRSIPNMSSASNAEPGFPALPTLSVRQAPFPMPTESKCFTITLGRCGFVRSSDIW